MADEVTLDKRLWRIGEEKPLAIIVTRDDLGSFDGATAVLDVYDGSGAQVVSAQPMTVSNQTTYCTASYLLTAKTGGHMEEPGNYDAFIKFTVGSTIRRWRIPILVIGVP